jgi:ABC-type transport system substrate-binding protein
MKFVHLTLAAGLTLVGSGCASESDSAQPEPPVSTVTTAPSDGTQPAAPSSFSVSLAEPASIDPALLQEVEGAQVVRLLFQTLVTLDPTLTITPGAAESWKVADDGVTWTFSLRDGATFSDGSAVDAGDFVVGFARAADPDLASPASYQGLPIKGWAEVSGAEASGAIGDVPVPGVTAIDDHTLQIVTEEPFALLPKVLTYPIFAPVPSELFVDGQPDGWADQPIGNGPYVLEGPWRHNEGITVVKNTAFAGSPGNVERIEFRIYSDSATAYRDLQAGALDIARNIPPETIGAARDELGDRLVVTQMAALYYIGLPTALPPFDDVDIRTALSLAIDRAALAERVLQGAGSPATGMVPPQVPGALLDPCDACAYDPDRARALLEKAGGIPGNTVVLYDISDDGQAAIEFIANSWREVLGLDTEVRSFEFAQYLDETAVGQAEGPFELGWVWDYPSGYSILSPLFESNSGANNLSWSDATFDDLMAKVRTSPDEEAGLTFLREAEQVVVDQVPLIPLLFNNDAGGYSARLSDVVVDTGALWRLELVTVS